MAMHRFSAKQLGEGRHTVWGVYDKVRGSYPYQTPELGKVSQDHPTENAAQDEVDRLTATFGFRAPKTPPAQAA